MKKVTSVVLMCATVLVAQPGEDMITEVPGDCSRKSESLERVLEALNGMTDLTSLLLEVRRLDRKVSKMGKALKKIGLLEDDNGEFVDPRMETLSTTTTSTTTSTPTTTTSTIDKGPCLDGWSHIGEGCYKIVTEQALSWEEARQQCLLQGTDLAEMNNIDEQRAFTKFLNNWHYGIPFWLGGHRNPRGKWRWEWTETRVPSRAVRWGWAELYPRSLDTINNTDCLAIRGRGQVGALKVWEDKECEENNNYVCEYLWIQEYMEEEMNKKITEKLEENLVVVENIRRARELEK